MGKNGDIRVAAIQEAVAFWNQQLDRAGEHVRLGPVSVVDHPATERILSDLSAAIMSGRSAHSLAPLIAQVPGEIIIAMSNADLMSFGVPWHEGAKGFVALRRADVPPLSLPNVARNDRGT